MNLIEAINDSKKYTLHTHTQFCDGRATMEKFAEQADLQHFDLYGFTPHSPIPFESPCNMKQSDVPVYLQEASRIQEKYPNIRFLKGMEIDYIDDAWGPASPYFKGLGLDYCIGSVHFLPTQEGEYIDIDGRYENFKTKMHQYFHDDIHYVVDKFFEQSHKMLAAGGFDIIGHYDKIKHNAGLYYPELASDPWYAKQAEDLTEAIIASGVIVEINTKAWGQHRQLFPDQRHWRRLLEAGAKIVINTDAHYPKLIDASRTSVENALNYLKSKIQSKP